MIIPPGFSQYLKVSDNGRYLVRDDGSPFFYLGDTAWELFHRLSKEEADQYLENRAKKGFTVIQAVVLSQVGGLDVPNAEGHKPLKNNDPRHPNEDYFKHVDYIVKKADISGFGDRNATHMGKLLEFFESGRRDLYPLRMPILSENFWARDTKMLL